MRLHLIEPHAGERISGGYVYNHRMAAGAPGIEVHAVRSHDLGRELGQLDLGKRGVVLVDSLFLTRELLSPFLALRRPGLELGVLMHALPSFITRAGERALLSSALPLLPTRDELELLEALDFVVAPGPYVPRLLSQCRASVRSIICPPGVDPRAPRVPVRRGPGEPLRLLSMGGVTPLKGFADAVLALAEVKSRAWRWTLIGHLGIAPAHVADLRRSVSRHGLEGHVHFTGQRSHEETLAELAQSDLLLVPSFTENHPLVALEALTAGVPVIGYEVGGLPDIIVHDETGLLAPLLDVSTLAALLERYVSEADTRERLSQGCLEAARTLLTWPEAARQLVAQLKQPTDPSRPLPDHE